MDMSEELGGEGAADSEDGSDDIDNLNLNDDEEHQAEDLQHEAEDLHELEAARKERMDLMAVELKKETGSAKTEGEEGEEKVATIDKFEYLIGQSEVFAHFLAGE